MENLKKEASPISEEESKQALSPSLSDAQVSRRSQTAPPPGDLSDGGDGDPSLGRGRSLRKTVHIKERSDELRTHESVLKRSSFKARKVPSLKLEHSRKTSPLLTPRTKSRNANRFNSDRGFLDSLPARPY